MTSNTSMLILALGITILQGCALSAGGGEPIRIIPTIDSSMNGSAASHSSLDRAGIATDARSGQSTQHDKTADIRSTPQSGRAQVGSTLRFR